jgi:Fe-S-cluster-containing hydrogenase component 2
MRDSMNKVEKVKILKFYADKCNGCLECEKACSKIHFKTNEGGDKSAIRIIKKKNSYKMIVCNQNGLCIDMCPVGALTRRKTGIITLDKNTCIGCQACVSFCPYEGMKKSDARIEPFKCISCGSCVRACKKGALELIEVKIDNIKKIVYHKQGV